MPIFKYFKIGVRADWKEIRDFGLLPVGAGVEKVQVSERGLFSSWGHLSLEVPALTVPPGGMFSQHSSASGFSRMYKPRPVGLLAMDGDASSLTE